MEHEICPEGRAKLAQDRFRSLGQTVTPVLILSPRPVSNRSAYSLPYWYDCPWTGMHFFTPRSVLLSKGLLGLNNVFAGDSQPIRMYWGDE